MRLTRDYFIIGKMFYKYFRRWIGDKKTPVAYFYYWSTKYINYTESVLGGFTTIASIAEMRHATPAIIKGVLQAPTPIPD